MNKSFVAFSFRQGFISPNIPIATFTQGDKELNFILDSGSDENVIDSNFLGNIEHEMTESKSSLAGLGGKVEVQSCIIPFKYGDEEFKAEFLVSDMGTPFNAIRAVHAIPIHGMLGSRFFLKYGMVLDFNSLTAHSKE